jgi:hypothetical protein
VLAGKGWTMRVEGTNRIGQQSSAVRRAQGGTGFSLPEAETSAPAQKAFGVSTVPGLDTLLALQSVDMAGERRRKGSARGRRLLDILDQVKLGVLDGTLSPATLQGLGQAVAEAREETGDPVLDAILAEIELRAEVELAKLARQPG